MLNLEWCPGFLRHLLLCKTFVITSSWLFLLYMFWVNVSTLFVFMGFWIRLIVRFLPLWTDRWIWPLHSQFFSLLPRAGAIVTLRWIFWVMRSTVCGQLCGWHIYFTPQHCSCKTYFRFSSCCVAMFLVIRLFQVQIRALLWRLSKGILGGTHLRWKETKRVKGWLLQHWTWVRFTHLVNTF